MFSFSPANNEDWQLSLLLPAHAGSSRADISTLKMEAISSSETAVYFTGSTRHQKTGFFNKA
jgi:hypothetical protein